MPSPGQEETVRIVALDRDFHVQCYRCEVSKKALGCGYKWINIFLNKMFILFCVCSQHRTVAVFSLRETTRVATLWMAMFSAKTATPVASRPSLPRLQLTSESHM